MPKRNLTDRLVQTATAPPGGTIDYFDTKERHLILRVNGGGKKVYRVLYYKKVIAKTGKRAGQRISMPTTHKLGRTDELTLKQARDKAAEFRANPAKALAQSIDGDSCAEVVNNFLANHVAHKQLRSGKRIERLLHKHVLPAWQALPFRALRKSDVNLLLDKIEREHGLRQADLVLTILSKMCSWFAGRTKDDFYVSPIVRGMRRYQPADHRRNRFLSDAEIRALWNACAELGTFGALCRILLLSGQRREKVVTMKWTDIAEDGTCTMPKAPREKPNVGTLRLPPLALDIIRAQPILVGNPYVFAGRGSAAFNSFADRKALLDRAMPAGTPHWQLHDLRRTCRSLMSGAKVRADVGELALGHSIKGIQATYDNRAAYQPMIDEAIQQVADEVAKILNPPPVANNVVNLDPQARR
jgi:integrase